MTLSPKQSEQKMTQLITAWETLASGKSFGGMTLPEFKAAAKPAQDAIAALREIEDRRTQALNNRDDAFAAFFQKVELVVNGVRADPEEGSNGALIEAMGYTRSSERKSGLTRKKPTPKT
jgi:hypothetical protein